LQTGMYICKFWHISYKSDVFNRLPRVLRELHDRILARIECTRILRNSSQFRLNRILKVDNSICRPCKSDTEPDKLRAVTLSRNDETKFRSAIKRPDESRTEALSFYRIRSQTIPDGYSLIGDRNSNRKNRGQQSVRVGAAGFSFPDAPRTSDSRATSRDLE